ncbi:phosphatidylserine/phosphatidylglycerophosphate/cardiolipin synthase-like enzyme [Tumebacillus permanentifrigoris]|uniref:Phosphatidylserine/phosphatidylglycerophosphate/ cardiolipin synthase-like enzyme n=2 Tax=Tumebacillus permanentifrigoris TaxID=378543 RepID=A0A316DD79_9BACL|nr:phosphatidylserine/phosphatidylglycerophosphate/cardiolipin synthase-like enzyme [Tumebacillus permanentifrigoris]
MTRTLMTAMLAAGLVAGMLPPAHSGAAAISYPLITEVYADTNLSNEPEEYIAVSNPTASAIALSGWYLQVGTSKLVFPSGATLAAGQTIYVTKQATAFKSEQLFPATYEYGADTDSTVPQMTLSGSVPPLANAGSVVYLYNASGTNIDTVAYGSGTSTTGWSGTAVPNVSGGVMFVRERDETSQLFPDSNTAADWKHLRVYAAGQSRYSAPTYTYAGTMQPYSSPDNSFNTVATLLNSATTTIDLNVYEFQMPQLMDVILNAINRGVKVRVFLEGSPVGGLIDQGKYVAQQIVNAGGQVRFIINDSTTATFKRYTFDHAKYAIIDSNKIMVQSENFKSSSLPFNTNYGNRGWGIVMNSANVASFYSTVFNGDWNVNSKDSFPFTASSKWGAPTAGFVPDSSTPTATYKGNFKNKAITGEFNVTPIFAPDSTFLQNNSILGLAKSATKSLLVEQLYAHKFWGPTTGSTTTSPDIYLEECINAARRGVKVRILLDSAFLDATDPRDNQFTVQYVNDIATTEHLDLQAKLIDLKTLGLEKVHNKGMLADSSKTLVSSINWSESSPENNREAGVIVDNPEVNAYYEQLFWYDWSAGLQTWSPDETKGTSNVVISEVNYDTNGFDATREYVELYNKNNVSVDLTNYKLTNKSGTFTIPTGTVIPAHSFLTVGKDSTGFSAYKGFGLDVSGMNLTLTNTGDDLFLKTSAGVAVDEVAWMNYVSGWGLSTSSGQVLSRTNPTVDTNSSADWTVATPSPKK